MRHTFSFSLQGTDKRYTSGIERNNTALLASGLDFNVVLHTDRQQPVPAKWQTVLHPTGQSLECHFWRFESVGIYSKVHVRDIDSTISAREIAELERSDIYCMRDCKYHAEAPYPVQGGMWGATDISFPYNFPKLVDWWVRNKAPFERYSDMWFLNRYVYPYIRRFGLEIDGAGSRWGGVPFSTPRIGTAYVGDVAT